MALDIKVIRKFWLCCVSGKQCLNGDVCEGGWKDDKDQIDGVQ